MSKPKPRIRLDKKEAKKGDLVEVKTLISHVMESGQRRDSAGKVIPRKIINKFTAGERQTGVRGRLRAGGLRQPLHAVQVPGRGIRPGDAHLDRRRRLEIVAEEKITVS